MVSILFITPSIKMRYNALYLYCKLNKVSAEGTEEREEKHYV